MRESEVKIMKFVGKWVFDSVGTFDENFEKVYLSAEEYIKSPMPYVDTDDAEAVADEMKERRQTVGSQIAVCEDGKLYMLMPLPDGVSREEIDQAVEKGIIKLYDGMMTDEPKTWEERDGALWIEVGEGMSEDGWAKLSDGDGYLCFMTARYVKAE